MTLWQLLADPFTYEFMQRALLTSAIAAVVCAVLSCWLTLVGWSLMGDAISHAVLPGVVIAYIVGAPFALGAVVFGLIAVTLISVIRGRREIREDSAIGIVFTTLFALGLVLISVTPSQTDLNHIVFGNVLGVTVGDFWQIVVIAVIVVGVLLFKRRDFTLFAFDPSHAFAIGLSTRRIGAVLLGLTALTTVVALQVVGVVLVVALLVTPGVTARLLTQSLTRMLVIAPAVSLAATVLGLYGSYYLNASPGGCIVVALGGLFALAYVYSLVRGALATRAALVRQ